MTGRRRLAVILWDRASQQIEEAANWWRINRSGSPEALTEEIERAFDLISRQPGVGIRAGSARLRGVRRVLLGRVDYFLFDRVVPRKAEVHVLALWHARRRAGPRL